MWLLPMQSVQLIAITAAINIILTCIAIFAPFWVTFSSNVPGSSGHVGLAPYHSFWPTWIQFAAIMMYASFALVMVVTLVFMYNIPRLKRFGLTSENRLSFRIIHWLYFFFTITQMAAFIYSAIGCAYHPDNENQTLGFSAYFALTSFIVSVVPGGLATHVAKYDCK